VLGDKGWAVHTVSPDATVFDAIGRVEHNVGSLMVADADGHPLGIVTERDYLRKVALQGRTSRATFVREIMSSELVTVAPCDDIEDCLALMTERRVRHLPVLDAGRLVGIVSVGDIVKYKLGVQRFEISQLTAYIQGVAS
jgi:CBS domain-containing protein